MRLKHNSDIYIYRISYSFKKNHSALYVEYALEPFNFFRFNGGVDIRFSGAIVCC
jgi:hypothetical protein